MMEKKGVLEWIETAGDLELSEIVRAVLDRYRILYPDEEVLFLSLPIHDRKERADLLHHIQEVLA